MSSPSPANGQRLRPRGSHEVNLGTTPVTVTAAPFLVATLEPVDARESRVRGLLASVDEGDGRYFVDLRPFDQPDAESGARTSRQDGHDLRGGRRRARHRRCSPRLRTCRKTHRPRPGRL